MFAMLERLLVMEVLIHHVDTLRFLLGPLTLAAASLGRSCSLVRGDDRASLWLTTSAGAAVSDRETAVDAHDGSGHVARIVGSDERDDRRDLGGLARAHRSHHPSEFLERGTLGQRGCERVL